MKIGLDVMGGDYAPNSAIKGAILANKIMTNSDDILLIGDKKVIIDILRKENADTNQFTIEHAPEIISMGENPVKSFTKKPSSSIVIGFDLLKNKHIDAFASAGNSGAMMVGSMHSINTIPRVIRPCTSAIIPKEKGGKTLILDIGTNPEPKADVLYQFAILGTVYARYVLKINNPRVGLLNIGEEENKGNLLVQSAYHLMKDTEDFNFIGNIEGRYILNNKADIIVCDGFTGNALIKQMESFYQLLVRRNLTDDYITRLNYENYGGTPILGINSSVILGHGISTPLAIKNMILLSKDVVKAKLTEKIGEAMDNYSI